MSDSFKAVKETGKKVATGLGYLITLPFAVPTFVRKFYEKGKDEFIPGFIGGGPAIMAITIGLGYGLDKGNLYAVACGATILSTNVISGLYELYRYERGKIKNSKPEIKKEPSELEVKVEEPVVTKSVKPHFVNPWEIEIKD